LPFSAIGASIASAMEGLAYAAIFGPAALFALAWWFLVFRMPLCGRLDGAIFARVEWRGRGRK